MKVVVLFLQVFHSMRKAMTQLLRADHGRSKSGVGSFAAAYIDMH